MKIVDSVTIYKSEKGKQEILQLYDRQLERLSVPYSDKFVSTSFGETHLIETGNPSGIPLLVFHGGNATTAYNFISKSRKEKYIMTPLSFLTAACFWLAALKM